MLARSTSGSAGLTGGASASRCGRLWSIVQHYALVDWLFALFLGILTFIFRSIDPHRQFIFSATDPRISYPLLPNTFTTPVLIVLAFPVPAALIVLCCYIHSKSRVLSRLELLQSINVALCGLFMSVMSSTFLTDIGKRIVGRPRPNFINLCQYKDGACTASSSDQKEAFMSFPSGHSSFAFSGLFYFTIFLLRYFAIRASSSAPLSSSSSPASNASTVSRPPSASPVNRGRMSAELRSSTPVFVSKTKVMADVSRNRDNQSIRLFLCFIPTFFAAYIAMTRITDYWHNVDDVLAGTLLGVGCATVCARLKFPDIFLLLINGGERAVAADAYQLLSWSERAAFDGTDEELRGLARWSEDDDVQNVV